MSVGEWDKRQLCSDGACVGVIGPNGTCKVCGRVAPNWGEERKRGLVGPAADDDGDEDDDEDEDDELADDEIAPSAPAVLGSAGGWGDRRLCPDGACIGVIGADGHCKVCGKAPAARAKAKEEEIEEEEEEDEEIEEEEEGEEEAVDDEDEDEGEDKGEDEDEDGDEADDEAASPVSAGAETDDDRRLCPDGACVGLIGNDGRCKVCGKEAAA